MPNSVSYGRLGRTGHPSRLIERANLTLNCCFFLVAHNPQIKLRLKIEPKIRRGPEEASKSKSHFRGDATLFVDDVVDARSRDVQSQSQLVGIQVKRRACWHSGEAAP